MATDIKTLEELAQRGNGHTTQTMDRAGARLVRLLETGRELKELRRVEGSDLYTTKTRSVAKDAAERVEALNATSSLTISAVRTKVVERRLARIKA